MVQVLREAQSRGLPLPPAQPAAGAEAVGLGAVGQAVMKEFEDSLSKCTSIYVEEELQKTVPSMVRIHTYNCSLFD